MIRIETATPGSYYDFQLATAVNGQPLFTTSTRDIYRPMLQTGDATYATFDPRTQGVYAPDDFSGGVGQRRQVPMTDHERFKKVRYAVNADFGSYGIGPGPKITTITKLTNMGSLTGAFELGGYLYLIGSRIIAKYDHDAGTIAEAEDLGSGVVGYGGATWLQLGTETLDQSMTSDTTADTIANASTRLAQSFKPGSTGYLSAVILALVRTGTLTAGSTVDVSIQLDRNGQPDGVDLVSTSKVAADISTSPANYTFRFEEVDLLVEKGATYWIVVAAAGASAGNTMGWRRDDTNPGAYTSGTAAFSLDGGDSYTNNTNSTDHYFATFMKAVTPTAFVGKAAGAKFLTTTDGATFTAESDNEGKHFCVWGNLLVRDCRADSSGAIVYSEDGTNWSEPIALGDTSIQVTALYALPGAVIVCKEDSIWAVDLNTYEIQMLHSGARSTSNGVGGTVWRGAAYIPFGGQLYAVEGDFASGFTRYLGIGPEATDEWESPWGDMSVVAVAGDRFCLYAACATGTGIRSTYKLFKSYAPLEKKWVGSIADLGSPTAFFLMYCFDRGGVNAPLLFFSTTSDNLGVIQCARTRDPYMDSGYEVRIGTGTVYLPHATGLFPANPKNWLSETFVFRKTAAEGTANVHYSTDPFATLLEEITATPVAATGVVSYPAGVSSYLLRRDVKITCTSATVYPILETVALSSAVIPSQEIREYRFTVEVGEGVSMNSIAVMLGISHDAAKTFLQPLPTVQGTRSLIDPEGDAHEVTFQSVNRVLVERATEGHSYFEIVAVGAG
jgi:hypothetical protein